MTAILAWLGRMSDVVTGKGTRAAPSSESRCQHLTYMHEVCILIHMRTTLNIDDETLRKASELTGVTEKTALVRLGLESLIAWESGKKLADIGGTEKSLRPIPRRKMGGG